MQCPGTAATTDNANRSSRAEMSPAGVEADNANVEAISEPSYVVGYRQPPLQHRFKPGHSGNKRGRPKRSHSTAAVFEAMFRSTVAMTVDGKRRRLTVLPKNNFESWHPSKSSDEETPANFHGAD